MWLVMKQFECLAASCSTLLDQRRKMPGCILYKTGILHLYSLPPLTGKPA